METISIICDSLQETRIPGPKGREGSSGDITTTTVDGKPVKFLDVSTLKTTINKTIKSIVSLIDEQPIDSNGFEVTELEFSLAIQGETSVSLFSAFSAGVSANSEITVRITKKA
jgi:hypothetical protein